MLEIEDNAGFYQPVTNASGLGMNLVDKRLRERFGDDYGISVACEPDRLHPNNVTTTMEGRGA